MRHGPVRSETLGPRRAEGAGGAGRGKAARRPASRRLFFRNYSSVVWVPGGYRGAGCGNAGSLTETFLSACSRLPLPGYGIPLPRAQSSQRSKPPELIEGRESNIGATAYFILWPGSRLNFLKYFGAVTFLQTDRDDAKQLHACQFFVMLLSTQPLQKDSWIGKLCVFWLLFLSSRLYE